MATIRIADAVGGLSVASTLSTISTWNGGGQNGGGQVGDGAVRAVAQIGEIRAVVRQLAVTTGTDIVLELRTEPTEGSSFSTRLGPDQLVAGVVDDDGFTELGHLDGRYLSTEFGGRIHQSHDRVLLPSRDSPDPVSGVCGCRRPGRYAGLRR